MNIKLKNNVEIDIYRGLIVLLTEESRCKKDEYLEKYYIDEFTNLDPKSYKEATKTIPANTALIVKDFDYAQWYDDAWMGNDQIIFVQYEDKSFAISSLKFKLCDLNAETVLVI